MTEYYVRIPWGRYKLAATNEADAIAETLDDKKRMNYEWVALDAITKTTIFDSREEENV